MKALLQGNHYSISHKYFVLGIIYILCVLVIQTCFHTFLLALYVPIVLYIPNITLLFVDRGSHLRAAQGTAGNILTANKRNNHLISTATGKLKYLSTPPTISSCLNQKKNRRLANLTFTLQFCSLDTCVCVPLEYDIRTASMYRTSTAVNMY